MKTISKIAAATFIALFIFAGNAKADGTDNCMTKKQTVEATLEIENWMINDNVWNTENSLDLTPASDEVLTIESWMTDENIWDIDSEPVIEPWMLDENIWK